MLSQEQIQKLQKAGYSDTKIRAFAAQYQAQQKPEVKEPGYLQRVGEQYQAGAERIREGIQTGAEQMQSGQPIRGALTAGLRTAGTVAAQAFTPILEAPGIKQATEAIVEGATDIPVVQQIVQKGSEIARKNPELAKDVEDIVNLATLGGGKAIEKPVSDIAIGAGKKVGQVAGDITEAGIKTGKVVKQAVGDVIPSSERVINDQITKALDLTQGDVKNIAKSTGNEVGRWVADKNLIGSNKDETVKLIEDFYKNRYDTVRTEIGNVKKAYSPIQVPRYQQALNEIKKQVSDVAGLEDVSKEVDTLLKKQTVTLNDVQRAKELLDDQFSLYKITGDVKEGATKKGLVTMRQDLRKFIEDEVQTVSGADIRALNNDVSTARGISNYITERATRGLTRSNIKLGDLGVFGAVSAVGSPLVGAAAVAAKKILESSPVRLRISRYLDGISDARKLRIQKELEQGVVPKEIDQIIKSQTSDLPSATSIKKNINQNTSISPLNNEKKNLASELSTLLKNKQGEVVGGLTHKDIGDIDIIYGKSGEKGYGLAKIASKHPEMIEVIKKQFKNAKIVDELEGRIKLETPDGKYRFIVDRNFGDKDKVWLFNAYKINS